MSPAQQVTAVVAMVVFGTLAIFMARVGAKDWREAPPGAEGWAIRLFYTLDAFKAAIIAAAVAVAAAVWLVAG